MADALFEGFDMAFTKAMKLAAVEREVRYRRHVYPRRVAAGKMTQDLADKQIAVMEAIAADYREPT